jgi:hypothetical protein
MKLIQHIKFLTNGRSSISFGPWALAAGPRTPVITNCPFGQISGSLPIKGTEHPSDLARVFFP